LSSVLCLGRRTPTATGPNVFGREEPFPFRAWAAKVDEQGDWMVAGGEVIKHLRQVVISQGMGLSLDLGDDGLLNEVIRLIGVEKNALGIVDREFRLIVKAKAEWRQWHFNHQRAMLDLLPVAGAKFIMHRHRRANNAMSDGGMRGVLNQSRNKLLPHQNRWRKTP